jgi:hypothetical protein
MGPWVHGEFVPLHSCTHGLMHLTSAQLPVVVRDNHAVA